MVRMWVNHTTGVRKMSPNVRVDAIADSLRQLISGGEYGKSGRLPSLRMLADQFNTTHETINKVIQQLQAEGLLISMGRAGVFVNSSRKRISGITPRFDLALKELDLEVVETNLAEPAEVKASAEVAIALNVDKDTKVIRRYRRQGTPTAPYRLVESFYPVELAGGIILEQMQKDEHFDVLAAIKEVHGKVIKHIKEDIIGRLPTSQEMEMLMIGRSTPVLEILRRCRAADEDVIVMYNHIIFVANYCELSYEYDTPYWLSK